MSYETARRQFQEIARCSDRSGKGDTTLRWNLASMGLANIAEGLDNDLSDIKSKLVDILERLDSIERSSRG